MNSFRFRLSDWPFAFKVGIAPAIAVVLLIVVVFMAQGQMSEQKAATDNIVQQEMAKSVGLSEISGALGDINGRLFRVLTLQAAEVDGLDSMAEIETLKMDITSLATDMELFRDKYLHDDEAADFTSAIEEVTKYGEAVDLVGQMLELDFASAVGFVQPFEQNYNDLKSRMAALVAKTVRQANQQGADAADRANAASNLFLIIGFVAAVSVITASFLIGRNVVLSIRRIANTTKDLAEDNTDVDIESLARKDELGGVVESLLVFRNNIESRISLQSDQERMRQEQEQAARERRAADERAKEDEAARAEAARSQEAENRRDSMNTLANQFDSTVTTSLDTAGSATNEVADNAEGVLERAVQNKEISENLKVTSHNVGENMQSVASATEQLTSSISEISHQVSTANDVSNRAVEEAENSSKQIETLSVAVDKIGEALLLIKDIADQTNLLALNATIEAARAGEAGRGFAVVASEVKNLAAQTANATVEIEGQISGIQNATNGAVNSISQVGDIIGKVDEIATGIAGAVEEQSATTQEISRSIQEVNADVAGLSEIVGDVDNMAEANSVAADTLKITTGTLSEIVENLKGEANLFVSEVRSNN